MVDGDVQKNIKWYDLEDKTERNVKLANEIADKIKALDMKRPPIGTMRATLADLCINLEDDVRLINQFLKVNAEDKRTIGRLLVEMRTCLDDVRWHYNHVKKILERVIEYCYEPSK